MSALKKWIPPSRRFFPGRHFWGRFSLLAFILWLYVVVVLAVVIDGYGRVDRAQPADVIVVLGAGLRRNNAPGPALIRRTARAAELYQAGFAPAIICTGAQPYNRTRSEADACAELLRQAGVPADAIMLEEDSRSTEENAIGTAAIMSARGWRTALVVSDGFHLFRALRLFSQQGIPVFTSPAQPLRASDYLSFLLREIIAFHWQLVKEAFNLPITYVQSL